MEHDNKIKTKLEQRRIQPSSNSWDRLEMMLDKVEETPGKKGYLKYAIAASVLLLLSVAFLMDSNSLEVDNTPTVADEKVNKELINTTFEDEKEVLSDINIESRIVESTENNLPEKVLLKKENSIKNRNYKKVDNTNDYRIRSSAFAVNEKNKKNTILAKQKNDNVIVGATVALDGIKAIEVVTQKETKESLELEVDALLASAFQDLSKKPTETIQKETGIVVDSEALLAGVEEELDKSFKSKVFNKLKKGFQKAQTAVVNRND